MRKYAKNKNMLKTKQNENIRYVHNEIRKGHKCDKGQKGQKKRNIFGETGAKEEDDTAEVEP